jgi:NitT/TauT family transport system substrate-binding protein
MSKAAAMRVVFSAVLLCLTLPPGLSAQERKITLGVTSRTGVTSLPFVIAEEKGFFKAEGLNVTVVQMQNQVVVQGVLAKQVDYGGTFSNFIGAALTGAPLRLVMAVMDGSDHVLVTAPGVKAVQDLKGKIVGISSFGGTPHSEAILVLRKYGLDPEKDVTFVQIGGSSSRYTALEAGTIHAAMLEPPFNKMGRKRGFNELVVFDDVLKIPLAGLGVHADTIRERPGEIVKMIKAVLRSLDYIRSQKAEVLAAMEKGWGVKDPDVREGIYTDVVDFYTRTGVASDDKMQNAVRLVQEGRKTEANVPLSQIVDWSFARRASEERRAR